MVVTALRPRNRGMLPARHRIEERGSRAVRSWTCTRGVRIVPNLRSSIKRVRVSAKKAARNRPIRAMTRTLVAHAEAAIAGTSEESAAAVQRALRQLDRAVSKGVIHRNNAARRKSRLMKKLNQ